jgi:hypothetical protein
MFKNAKVIGIVLPIVFFILLTNVSYAQQTFCVRSDATGDGSGVDWDNAYVDLPSTLERGATYYIADGGYGPYVFDDDIDGEKYITVKKATAIEHGTEVGWFNSYGDEVAEWNCDGCSDYSKIFYIKTSYIIFDGVTGGGPDNWTSSHGFDLSSDANVFFIYIGNSSSAVDFIEIRHTAIGSPFPPVAGIGTGTYIRPAAPAKRNIIFSHCYLHDLGDSMNPWYDDVSDIFFEYNYVTRNATSPASHGAGMEFSDVSNVHIRYNVFTDITGTGVIGIYNSEDGIIENLYIYGNIFRNTPDFVPPEGWNGVVYCTSGSSGIQRNIKVYNNSFYNIWPPSILLNTKDINGHEALNNVFVGISGGADIVGYTHDYSVSDILLDEAENNIQIIASGTFIDPSSINFYLVEPTAKGFPLPAPFNEDMFGTIRGVDGHWDRGAIEYTGEFIVPENNPGTALPPSGIRVSN